MLPHTGSYGWRSDEVMGRGADVTDKPSRVELSVTWDLWAWGFRGAGTAPPKC